MFNIDWAQFDQFCQSSGVIGTEVANEIVLEATERGTRDLNQSSTTRGRSITRMLVGVFLICDDGGEGEE